MKLLQLKSATVNETLVLSALETIGVEFTFDHAEVKLAKGGIKMVISSSIVAKECAENDFHEVKIAIHEVKIPIHEVKMRRHDLKMTIYR